MESSINFVFKNWPVTQDYCKCRIHFVSDTNGSYTFTLSTISGTLVKESGFPGTLTASSSGAHIVIDVWSFDAGAHVYVNKVGTF